MAKVKQEKKKMDIVAPNLSIKHKLPYLGTTMYQNYSVLFHFLKVSVCTTISVAAYQKATKKLYHPIQGFLYHYVSTIYYTKDVPKTLYIQRFLYHHVCTKNLVQSKASVPLCLKHCTIPKKNCTILSKGFCTTMCQTLPALLTLASQSLRQVSAATTTSRYILSK